jgi:hypothetical protein
MLRFYPIGNSEETVYLASGQNPPMFAFFLLLGISMFLCAVASLGNFIGWYMDRNKKRENKDGFVMVANTAEYST